MTLLEKTSIKHRRLALMGGMGREPIGIKDFQSLVKVANIFIRYIMRKLKGRPCDHDGNERLLDPKNRSKWYSSGLKDWLLYAFLHKSVFH